MTWSQGEVLEAVRVSLAGAGSPGWWRFLRAEVEPQGVLVVFEVEDDPTEYGVHYALDELPRGPSTGIARDTALEWASEVWIDLDEEICTRGVERALRSPRGDAITGLVWQRTP